MLELRHLRTVAALRSAGTLGRAAQLLNLTQSALSHQVKLLEALYGCPLFERKSAPIAFTAAGTRLLELADLVLPRVEQAGRDLARLVQGGQGRLRVALECNTSFDWLMPVLDRFRQRWPEVETDLLASRQGEPARLLHSGAADLVIGPHCGAAFAALPLFRFETLALLSHSHRLAARRRLDAADFAGETIITYPVAEARVDLIREVLQPAQVGFTRRTAELTAAIMQLVASRRGLAALPAWAAKPYVDDDYLLARPIGADGLWSDLFASVAPALAARAYVLDFASLLREQGARALDGIQVLA